MPRLPRFSPSGGSSTKKRGALSVDLLVSSSFSPSSHSIPLSSLLCPIHNFLDSASLASLNWIPNWSQVLTGVCCLQHFFLKKHQKKERFQKDRKQEWQNWEKKLNWCLICQCWLQNSALSHLHHWRNLHHRHRLFHQHDNQSCCYCDLHDCLCSRRWIKRMSNETEILSSLLSFSALQEWFKAIGFKWI